jgi:hypothetical protein
MSAAVCRLCGGEAAEYSRQRLLGKHDVRYFRCADCELIESEAPYWLDEAYSHALAELDTGALVRNQMCARLTLAVALAAGVHDGAGLDFGGAHGVLVRMLRDFGLDFAWHDRFAQNWYARGFEGDVERRYSMVTAFEVLEHFADVGAELDRLFRPDHDLVLVGTLLHRNPPPDWWYYTPESGQHIAFYSCRTMKQIAARHGYDAFIGDEYVLFARHGFELGVMRRALLERIVRAPRLVYGTSALIPDPLLFKLGPLRSRTQSDFELLRARARR